MSNLIQFTILSHWKHVTNGTGVIVKLRLRAEDEKELRTAGLLTMTDAAWNMLQTQLCPSYHSDQCAMEVIETESDW